MSTKTSIKRIALVAVSALGFGLLSVVPAKAAVLPPIALDVTAGDGSNAADTITAAVTTFGSVSRTDADTWTVPYSIAVTGTGFVAATSDFNLVADNTADDGTFAYATATSFTIAFDTGAATVNSATSANIAGNITVDADDATKAKVLAAAGTYTLGINVEVDAAPAAGEEVTATAVSFTISAGAYFDAPTLLLSKVSNSSVSQVVGGQANLLFNPSASAAAATYLVTVTGATMRQATEASGDSAIYYTDSGNAIGGTGTYSQGVTLAGDVDVLDPLTHVDTFTLTFSSAVAGVSTISFTPVSATGVPGTATTATITWVASADQYSNSTVSKVLGTSNFSGSTYYASATASANPVATFSVVQKDSTGTALASTLSKAVVVTLTGVGSLASATGGASTGVIAVPAATWANDGTGQFSVYGNGTAGTSTVAVSVGGSTVWSKSFVFYGTPATIEAEANYTIVRAGGYEAGELDYAAGEPTADNDPAIAVSIKDSVGNVVPVAASFVSSNPAVIVSSATDSFVDTGTGEDSAGYGLNHFTYSSTPNSTSGQTSDITFTYRLSNGTVLTSNIIKVTTGGTKTGGTVTMALDKTTYQPGERMIITFTGKDSAGNPVHDGATVGTLSSNKAVTNLASAQGAFVNGSRIYGDGATELIYAPAVSGPFTITLATGTATGATITATATVGDDAATSAAAAAADAAAEAIDAANAATDAANLAAEAADAATVAAEEARDAADAATAAVEELASQVATLMAALKAQITTLANTVAKIAKKVKA